MATRTSSRQLAAAQATADKAPEKRTDPPSAKRPRGMRGYAWIDSDGNVVDSPTAPTVKEVEKPVRRGRTKDTASKDMVDEVPAQQEKTKDNDGGWTTVGSNTRGSRSSTSRKPKTNINRSASARQVQDSLPSSPTSPSALPIMAQRLPSPASAALLLPDSRLRPGLTMPTYAAVAAMALEVVGAAAYTQATEQGAGHHDQPSVQSEPHQQPELAVDLDVSGMQDKVQPVSTVDGAKKRVRSPSLVADLPSPVASGTTSAGPPAKRRKTGQNDDITPVVPAQPPATVRIAPLTASKRLMLEAAAAERSNAELTERESMAKVALQTPDWLSPVGATSLGATLEALETSSSGTASGNAELDRRMQARVAAINPATPAVLLSRSPSPVSASTPSAPKSQAGSQSISRAGSTSASHVLSAPAVAPSLINLTFPLQASPARSAPACSAPPIDPSVTSLTAQNLDSRHSLSLSLVNPGASLSAVLAPEASSSVLTSTALSEPVACSGGKARKKKKAVRRKDKQPEDDSDEDDDDPLKMFRDMSYFPMPKPGDRLQAMLTETDPHPTRAAGLKGHLFPARKVCFPKRGGTAVYKHSLPCDYEPLTKYLEPKIVSQRRYQLWTAFAKGGQRLAEISRSLTIAIHLDLDRSKREVDVWTNPWVLAHFGTELDEFVEQLNGCATRIKTESPSLTDAAGITTAVARDAQLELEKSLASLEVVREENRKLLARLEAALPPGQAKTD